MFKGEMKLMKWKTALIDPMLEKNDDMQCENHRKILC